MINNDIKELIEALVTYALNREYKIGWVHYAVRDLKLPVKSDELKPLIESLKIEYEQKFTNDLNYYDVLKIHESANFREIREAYLKQIQLYHPDKVSRLGEKLIKCATEQSKLITEAYYYFKENYHGYKNH